MKEFLSSPLVLLAITFAVYYASMRLQIRFKSALLSPIIITMSVLIGYLLIFNISYETYAESGVFIELWLKPSIVALGVPLYVQLEKIKKQLIPLLVSQFAGSLVGIVSVCLIAKWLGTDKQIVLSLAPKSVTTPIAIEVSQTIGGEPAFTAAVVIITGIIGTLFGLKILQLFRIQSPIAKSVSLGAAAHGMGIIAAMRLSEKHATFASLGLIFNGIFTALLAPYTILIMEYFGWI